MHGTMNLNIFVIPTKCASLLFIPVSITSLLRVSVCCIHHIQEKNLLLIAQNHLLSTACSVCYIVVYVTLLYSRTKNT
jgi:hypothetical protein